MVEPAPLKRPRVQYTEQALEMGVQGTSVVRCLIRLDGRATDCCVASSLPCVDRAVVDALEASSWRPATLEGKPVEVDFPIRLTFRLPTVDWRKGP